MHSEFQYNIALREGNLIYTVGGTNEGAFESYDVQSKKWIDLPVLPVPVSFGSGVVLDHALFVLGGIDTLLQFTDAFQKFDLFQNKWLPMPGLTVSRSRMASVVCQGKIYLIGGLEGHNDRNAQNSSLIEAYNPATRTWQKKSDMPTSRHGLSALTVNDKIIVAGGFTNDGATSIVEEYDPLLDKWTRLADLPAPNGFFGLITIDNKIYAIGGRLYHESSPIIKYDVIADQWTEVGTIPEVRNRFGIAVDDKHVYIIGGEENPKSVWIGKKD